jgi:hypothetical protein
MASALGAILGADQDWPRGTKTRVRPRVERFFDAVRFEVVAPVPFSTVCFRSALGDAADRDLLAAVNADGRFFLSHTVLGGRFTLRAAIGNLRTEERHVDALADLLAARAAGLAAAGGAGADRGTEAAAASAEAPAAEQDGAP